MRITLARGDITEQQVDTVVNAASRPLLGGGGVDGARFVLFSGGALAAFLVAIG